MKHRLLPLLSLLALAVAGPLSAAPAPKLFTEGVRSTEPLSPEEQRLKFHLPDGFKIQLVAAEPDLRKPMNMAFDSAGRRRLTARARRTHRVVSVWRQLERRQS